MEKQNYDYNTKQLTQIFKNHTSIDGKGTNLFHTILSGKGKEKVSDETEKGL